MNNFTIKPFFYTISTFTDHYIKPLAFPLRSAPPIRTLLYCTFENDLIRIELEPTTRRDVL